jgi:hypothetical protein
MSMFIDVAMSAVHSEHRRQTLLAEAREYRLAALARAARRTAHRAVDQGMHRIGEGGRDPAPSPGPQAAPQVTAAAAGKADANCR